MKSTLCVRHKSSAGVLTVLTIHLENFHAVSKKGLVDLSSPFTDSNDAVAFVRPTLPVLGGW